MRQQIDIFIPGNPVCKDIVAKRNDTFVWEITGFNEDGIPFDFSNKEFLLQVRESEDSDEILINMEDASFTADADSAGTAAGVLNLLIIKHDKAKMDLSIEGKPYDLQYTTSVGKETYTFYEGTFTVTKDVSRLSS